MMSAFRTAFTAGAMALAAFAFAPLASARDYYASFSVGASALQDSDNSGAFTSDFATGAGATIPAGTVLAAGTPLGWTTEFDTGYAVSAAVGRRLGAWRGEIELAYQSNDIDTHNGVQAGGIALGGEDAGVLITGSPNLGVTVAELVDDGSGSVESTFLMANVFYDFSTGGPFTPYLGGGLGVARVEVDYSPSGVGIINDDDTVIAYQAVAGATYALNDRTELFAQARYRGTDDVETSVDLFDATLEIENRAVVAEAGLRFRF